MVKLIVLPPATKHIKKIKDKKLKHEFKKVIDRIIVDHDVGEAKTGNLNCVYGYDIHYNKTNYEIAYTIEYVENKTIIIIMAGTKENFYHQLKRYMQQK